MAPVKNIYSNGKYIKEIYRKNCGVLFTLDDVKIQIFTHLITPMYFISVPNLTSFKFTIKEMTEIFLNEKLHDPMKYILGIAVPLRPGEQWNKCKI